MSDNAATFVQDATVPTPPVPDEQAVVQAQEPSGQDASFVEPTSKQEKSVPRAVERYMEISGPDRAGRSKANCFLRSYLHYHDGTTKDVEELQLTKPIVNIFEAAGYVNVFLEFGRRTDEELNLAFQLVTRYMTASNSTSYFPEEVISGHYINSDGEEEMVYYPVLELAISPRGRETEYMIHGFRPLLYCLVGADPSKDLTMLQLVFKDNLFIVNEEIGPINYTAVQQDAMAEAHMESMGDFNPEDAVL